MQKVSKPACAQSRDSEVYHMLRSFLALRPAVSVRSKVFRSCTILEEVQISTPSTLSKLEGLGFYLDMISLVDIA